MSVQVVRKVRGRTVVLSHVGTAHDDLTLHALIDKAEEFMGLDAQMSLDIGIDVPVRARPSMVDISNYLESASDKQLELLVERGADSTVLRDPPRAQRAPVAESNFPASPRVISSPARLIWDVLAMVYQQLGFASLHDEAFMSTVIARVVKPTSKAQVPEVLASMGRCAPHENTIYNALKRCHERDYKKIISAKCHEYVRTNHQVTMVLYDVTTLYFETSKEDVLRKIGMSKERRVDPQIVVGLITDNLGFPLHVDFFHGKTAETTTLIPMLEAYRNAHDLESLTVVADAAMLSATNLDELDAAGINYIVADRLKKAPHAVTISDDDMAAWSKKTDTYEIVETTKTMGKAGNAVTRRVVVGFSPKRYKYDTFTLQKQKEKAQATVAGKAATRLPRFVSRNKDTLRINESAFDKALALAGWKGYVTNLDKDQVAGSEVISLYHELHHIENAFRMAKTDLQARPIFHRTEDAIQAHLTIVLAALAMSKHIYLTCQITTPKLVATLSQYRHALVETGKHRYEIPPQLTPEIEEKINQLKNFKPGD